MSNRMPIQNISRPGRGRYRRRSLDEKRRIVEACLAPGASVAGIALAHGVNANLVRKWIGKYRAGDWGTAWLPVCVEAPAAAAEVGDAPGVIEIELAGARLRLTGRVDGATLERVLERLRA